MMEEKKEEKTLAEQLSEKLMIRRKNGFMRVTDEIIDTADAFCEGYKSFLDAAKTEREAVKTTVQMAQEAGFTEFDPAKTYAPGDKVYYNNREKALILAVIGKEGCKNGVRISAAHIDAPRLDLKPIPLYETSDLVLLKTHYYGGIKNTSGQQHRFPCMEESSAATASGSTSASANSRASRNSALQTCCRIFRRSSRRKGSSKAIGRRSQCFDRQPSDSDRLRRDAL